ncbi:MAG: hypothetical protein WAW73_09405 [Rhodoferax sp.]
MTAHRAINLLLAFINAALLAATTHAQVINVLVHPSDRVVTPTVYSAQIQPIEEADPVRSVARQAALGGPVILWIGRNPSDAQRNYPALIAEAARYSNIQHIYLYDELFWHDGSMAMGLHEAEVLQGARLARAAGLQPLVTILPDVILHTDFALADINALSGIAVDVYPSIRPTTPDLGGCRFSENHLENLMYCSAQKLRRMGFTGQIGYIYQAFGLHSQPEPLLRELLLLQRQAVDNAEALGASAVMPWGLYLGRAELAREPDLYPLAGTKLERLVRP